MNKQRLLSEAKSLMQQTQKEDAVFVGFLQTMAKYPAFSVMAEAGLHLHAPDYAIMLAPRTEWEQEHGTTVLPGSMPIPLLTVAENGDASVDYVYDVQDTAGFNNGDSDVQALAVQYTPAYEQAAKTALQEAGAGTIEAAVSRAIRKAVVKIRPQQPELMAAAAEYIIRDRLNLPHEAGILQGIDRAGVDMEAFLEETRQLTLPMLHEIEKAVHNGQVLAESEETEYEDAAENATNSEEGVRDIRGPEKGVPVPEPQGDLAGNAGEGDTGHISDAVPAGDAGKSGQAGSADDENSRPDGAAEAAGRDGVHGQAEQPAIAGHGNHAAGNPRLSEREANQRYTYIRQDVAREAYGTGMYTEPFAKQEELAQELLADLNVLAGNGSTWVGGLKENVELLVKSMHPTRETKLADWYAAFNPEYADSEQLADMTLDEFYTALVNGEDIYRVANIGTSDTREALFYATALATGEELTDIYTRFANGGSLTHEEAPALSEEERQQAQHAEEADIWAHRLSVFDYPYIAKLVNHELTKGSIQILGELHEKRFPQAPAILQKIESLLESFNFQQEAALLHGKDYAGFRELAGRSEQVSAPKQEYGYYLAKRPAGPGAQPTGFVRLSEETGTAEAYGTVYYDHPLTAKEQEDYELIDAARFESRHEPIRSFVYEKWQSIIPEGLTFAEAYERLEADQNFFEAFGLSKLAESVSREERGEAIYEAFDIIGKEMAHRMFVSEQHVLVLMGKGYTREVGAARRKARMPKTPTEQTGNITPAAEAGQAADAAPARPAEDNAASVETAAATGKTETADDNSTEPAPADDAGEPEAETAGEEPAFREQATPSLAIKELPVDHSFKGISFDRLDLEADMSTGQGRHAVFARNIAAVQIARHLEATGHQANKEELAVLRSYSGFGGLADAFDETKTGWHEEYKLLHETFTESELTALIISTRTAYYTPNFVTKAIAEGLSDMGFKGGNVLDPSTGSGRFLQALTPEQQAKSHMVGIELDPVTALVARYANPDAEIVESGFERTNYPDGAFDLAITNVPFDNLPINDPRYPGNNYLIHDYFINRMVDEVRPNGLVVAVTSKGTMDKLNSTARETIARKAELLGSWRMPAEFFEGAGTKEAESDILVFRKREQPLTEEDVRLPDWVHVATTQENRRINRYYYDAMHDDVKTEHYLGYVEKGTNRYGEKVFVAKADRYKKSPQEVNDQLASDLRKGIGSLPAYKEGHTSQAVPQQEQKEDDNRPYGYYVEGNRLIYLAPNGQTYDAMQQDSGYAVPQKYRPAVLAAIKIRDKVQEIFSAELRDCTEMELNDLQADLKRLYDNYTRSFGTITERTTDKNGRERYTMLQNILRRDASWAILSSLEVQDEDGKVAGLSDIFTERTIHASRPPEHVDTAQEAVVISLGEKGYIDIPYIADLAGISHREAIEELEYKSIYDTGNGQYVTAEEYLSGDIRQKIDDVQAQIKHKERLISEVVEESLLDMPEIYQVNHYKERTFKPLTKPIDNPEEEAAFLQMALAPENRADFYNWLNADYNGKNLSSFIWSANDDATKPSPIREWLADPRHALELIANVPLAFGKNYTNFAGFKKLNQFHSGYMYSVDRERMISYLKYCLDHEHEGELLKFNDYTHMLNEQKKAAVDNAASDPDLKAAVQQVEHLKKNLAALESVKPKDLTAEDIRINLGATWVPTDDIRDFVAEITKADKSEFTVYYDKLTSSWKVEKGKNWKDAANHARCFEEYGTDDFSAVDLIERIMNHTQTQVWKEAPGRFTKKGNPVRVVDPERTLLARQKMEDIRDVFQKWIFKDPSRRNRLVDYYNRHFNNVVSRKYDGSCLTFPGMNPAIQLYPHQKDAIARSLFGGNTLFAHVVGAGKSFEMQASAMESKRLGICHKSMMIMPNFLTEQFGQEFHRLYPDAKILVAGPDDLDKKHRREFIAKITSQPWDAVIMSYEQFQKIPLSVERQKAFYEKQIQECKLAIAKGKIHFTTKQAAARLKSLENQLHKIQQNAEKHADDFGLTFEQLGCDRLYVDESHNFKNLRFLTRMSGMNNQGAEKTDDMLMKVAYLNNITGERGVIFASGTPVSNSMSELYSIQRYLKPSRLQEMGLYNFDAWASAFGRETTKLELKPEGTGFAMKTRFSEFCNIPELISMFHEFADVKTADMLDLKVPDLERKLVVAEPSAVQKEMLADLCARADEIHDKKPRYLGEGEPDDDSSKGYDNMLVVTNDGRKLALDPRLCGEEYDDSDNKDSKVELCAQNVAKIFSDTADEKLTQLVFCDLGTPKAAENGVKPFSVYDAFKEKLLERGIPADQVAFIHDYDTPAKKQQLFQRVRRGQVRILMGSSDKLGIGANVQDKVIAMHNLDCPWKPAQIEQRLGRGVRQGNLNEKITVYDYMTNGTFDAYMWQTNENKQRFISQIMTSRSPVRNAEDVDELVLDYATAKAACTGNPLFKEQMELQNDIARLEAERSQYLKYHEQIKHKLAVVFPENISALEKFKENIQYTLDKWQSAKDTETLVLDGKEYKGEEIGKVLQKWAKDFWNDKREHTPVGTYHGLKVSVVWEDGFAKLVLSSKFSYRERIVTSSAKEDAERLQNAGRNIAARLEKTTADLGKMQQQQAEYLAESQKPFAKEEEYQQKKARLQEVTVQIEQEEAEKELQKSGDAEEAPRSHGVARSLRLAALRGDEPQEKLSPTEKYYLAEARYQYQLNGRKWDAAAEKKVISQLAKQGCRQDTIIEAVSRRSPLAGTEQEALALVKQAKQQAACR